MQGKRIVEISLLCSTICNSGMGSPALVTSQLPPENTKVLAFGNCYRPLDMLQSVINILRALILPFNLHIFPYDTFLLSRSCCTVVRYIGEASYSLTRMPLHFNMPEKESNPMLGVFFQNFIAQA